MDGYARLVKKKWEHRLWMIRMRKLCGFETYHSISRLEKAFHMDEKCILACITLLKVKNFRSSFKKSLANQVREWAENDNPKYPTPLSARQFDYIAGDIDFNLLEGRKI